MKIGGFQPGLTVGGVLGAPRFRDVEVTVYYKRGMGEEPDGVYPWAPAAAGQFLMHQGIRRILVMPPLIMGACSMTEIWSFSKS